MLVNEQPSFYDFHNGRLIINLLSHCNLSCNMCGVKRDVNQGALSKEVSFQIARFGIENRFRVIEISGGEPFMVKYIYDLLDYLCRDCEDNTMVFITTNGTLFNSGDIDRLAKLRNFHCQISIDGMEPYHNRIRGSNHAFKRADWTIREMDRRGISISINSVIQNCNYESMLDLYRFFADVNYKWHSFPLYEPDSVNVDEVRISPYDANRLENILRQIKDAAEKEKKPARLSEALIEYFIGRIKGRDASYIHPGLCCTVPYRSVIVNHRGDVSPCFHYDWFKYDVERNIRKRSISEIVFSKEFLESIYHAVSGNGCSGCSTLCYDFDSDFSRKVMNPTFADKILMEIQQSIKMRDPSSNLSAGNVFERCGDIERAITEYKRSFERAYDPIRSLYHLASILKRTGHQDEALKYFEQMDNYEYNPCYSYYFAQRYFHRGEIYYESGEIYKACEDFKRCLEFLPEHKKAKKYLERQQVGNIFFRVDNHSVSE